MYIKRRRKLQTEIKDQVKDGTADKCYKMVDDKLFRVVNGKPKIFIPKYMRWRIVWMYHDDDGHPGPQRTSNALMLRDHYVMKFVARAYFWLERPLN